MYMNTRYIPEYMLMVQPKEKISEIMLRQLLQLKKRYIQTLTVHLSHHPVAKIAVK